MICWIMPITPPAAAFFFRSDGISLHSLGIVNDLLDHAHHTSSSRILLVILETRRRRRTSWLLLKKSSFFLLIEALQDLKGRIQELLRGTLICNSLLELFVLFLTVFSCPLHLDLRFLDLRLQAINVGSERLDGHFQVLDLGNEIRFLTLFLLGLELVGVEFLDAEILVLDLILLLLQKL